VEKFLFKQCKGKGKSLLRQISKIDEFIPDIQHWRMKFAAPVRTARTLKEEKRYKSFNEIGRAHV